ncbi:class I adenylate cyclase [Pseudomonas sp. 5P_3.1_Bac2]|uniref:class I adenylate cyclase n=1 Tax=Pseudomonas sp. 5P_3.1_Bac2 TaxID=2971617 RepID=UPI0021C92639|nr:class I adenylate cyclase [Pseudomonas sp. 5P_3.1_Bac2]MCU1718014.1 class I adenylate cyclase [Pseudomonas sp. 5P_3.1_Bac2]
MSRHDEIRPLIDEGIDRKVLTQLRGRFLKINQSRLQHTLQAMSTRQQLVLNLLPLLLHVNHPLLPGYVCALTPSGLCGFEPSPEQLAQVQRLTRSFTYKPYRAPQSLPLLGLFLMGSLGSVAQAEQSDLDLWLCHASDLTDQQRLELQKKCQLLEAWAASQGAEAHFFLIDPQRFTQGSRETQLSSDDCGTTQHYLLLDEFYRTAIWLGGRTPMWWLVPSYEEHRYEHYTSTLLARRFVRAEDVLDFGHLNHIPAEEFIGAGMWQLFKGIESPYKSVLKLLLTEVYASEYPQVQCLSRRFKQAVYANRLDVAELDPYIMVYRRLEEYLTQRGESERLELVRRCLYLKVDRKLSRPPRGPRKSWQRLLLEQLSSNWQWDSRKLALLDSRSQWKMRQVTAERRMLVNELTYSYRFLSQFARTSQTGSSLNSRDMAVLGRRLYAAFERKAGKIEFINPGIAPDLAEDTLTLAHSANPDNPKEQQWAIYHGSVAAQELNNFAPLKRSRDLLELLAWSYRNGVIDSTTRLALNPGSSDLREPELQNLIGSLQQLVPLPLPAVDEAALLSPSQAKEVLLLVNVALDPLKQFSQQNLHMTTEHTDALAYSGVRENLVLSIDQVTLNSWHELLVHRYEGADALLDCLRDYLNNLPADGPLPNLRVRCFCRNRASAIAERVQELFQQALVSVRGSLATRYLLQISQRYHILDLRPSHVSHIGLKDLPTLIEHLGNEQTDYSALRLDRSALSGDDLALILPAGQPHCIQLFYRLNERGDEAELSVLDEHNSLWRQRVPYRDEQSLLTPLQRFFQAVLYRHNAALPLDSQPEHQPLQLLYYRIQPDAPWRPQRLETRTPPESALNQAFYDVQAIITPTDSNHASVTLYCNHQEFSELQYGAGLFSAVARHILAQRREPLRYPCYITDLDLSAVLGGGQMQGVHYLRYKSRLEAALNQALEQA